MTSRTEPDGATPASAGAAAPGATVPRPPGETGARRPVPAPLGPITSGTVPIPYTPRRRRRRTVIVLVVVAVVLLGLAAAGWVYYRGNQASASLRAVGATLSEAQASLADGDTQALVDAVPTIQTEAEKAREATGDPVWRVAESVPWVGPNLAAVRTVSIALDDVARDTLPVVAQLGTVLQAQELRGTDGRIDLAPLVAAAPDLESAAETADRAATSVSGIPRGPLLGRVAGPVDEVGAGLTEAARSLGTASRVATLLPPMLGSEGPRTYLLLSLNSAELRSAGGIVGAVAVLRAEDGSLTLVEQRTTVDLAPFAAPVLPLTEAELAVHGDILGRWVQDTVLTPDFPRSAELMREIWRQRTGGDVDGVIATDPVTVRYLLRATGSVQGPGGVVLDADNVLDELLHVAYLRLPDPDDADDFYTGVASAIFGAVSQGGGETADLVDQLAHASTERRVRVWSTHPEEQALLAGEPIGGAFLSGPISERAAGVFLNDATAGKLDYFLHTEVSVEEMQCTSDGATAVLRLDLAYDPPADIAGYPEYVTGTALRGPPLGSVATNVLMYAPVGSRLSDLRVGDTPVGGIRGTEAGRDVSLVTSWLAPGEQATYRVTVDLPDARDLTVWTTPTLTSPGVVQGSCDPAWSATD